jgi:hypothetical protein
MERQRHSSGRCWCYIQHTTAGAAEGSQWRKQQGCMFEAYRSTGGCMLTVEVEKMPYSSIEATDAVRTRLTVSVDRAARPGQSFGDCTSTVAATSVQPEPGTGADSQIRHYLQSHMQSTGCSLMVLLSDLLGIARRRARQRLGWDRSMSCFAGQAGRNTHRRLQC